VGPRLGTADAVDHHAQEEMAQLSDADLAAIATSRDFETIENGTDENGVPVFDVDTEQLEFFDASKPS
jgi:hypothetical protein